MSSRPSLDPYGGRNPLVDRMIGDVYPTVRFVAEHIPYLVFLAQNFTDLRPKEVEFQKNDDTGVVQWRYVEEGAEWKTLVGYDDITGPSIEFQQSDEYLQYRPVGQTVWQDLIPIADISGKTAEMQSTGNVLEWRLQGDSSWNTLLDLSATVTNSALARSEAAEAMLQVTSIGERQTALEAGQLTDALYFATFAEMNAVAGTPNQGAFVTSGAEAGQYKWSGSAWVFLRPDIISQKADVSDVVTKASKLELASQTSSIKEPFEGFSLYEVGPDGIVPLLMTRYDGKLYPLVWFDSASQTVMPGGNNSGGSAEDNGRSLAFVLDGALRAATPNGDRLLDDVSARRWVQVQTVNDVARGVFRDSGNTAHAAVVGVASGEIFPLNRVSIMVDNGQSNAPGQAGTSNRSVVYGEFYPHPDRVLMPATAANNVWMGTPTQGGASTQLVASSITGLARLRGSIAPTNQHGTIGVEAAARRWSMRAAAACDGYVPKMVVFSVGEGGQAIANMVKSPPAGFYNFANLRTALQRTVATLALTGEKAEFTRLNWQMSETDSGDNALGQKTYDLLKSYQTEFYPITGQTVPLRMMASQMSSFRGGGNQAVRSILSKALEVYSQWGDFFCTGPTYPYPFHTDYLHQSSVGHAMQGEFFEAAISQVEKTGHWKPLHMISAVRSGSNQIIVQLSEPATIDTAWLVEAIENAGITVTGTTVSSVQVNGTQLTINVADALAASQVNAALVSHPSSGDRAAATIPRSTIRSTASIGQWSAECGGRQMYKPLCHQFIAIGV